MESRLRQGQPKVDKADHKVGYHSGSPTVVVYDIGFGGHERRSSTGEVGLHVLPPWLGLVTPRTKMMSSCRDRPWHVGCPRPRLRPQLALAHWAPKSMATIEARELNTTRADVDIYWVVLVFLLGSIGAPC
nr:hypothetical protein Itr_chr09CG17530 [Ipomoea trifida]